MKRLWVPIDYFDGSGPTLDVAAAGFNAVEQLGIKLDWARNVRFPGVNYNEIARLLRISGPKLLQWERSRHDKSPTIDHLARIATVYNAVIVIQPGGSVDIIDRADLAEVDPLAVITRLGEEMGDE